MTNIISFSLWGDCPKYTVGAVENAKLAQAIYPGWKCRFYIGDKVPESIICELVELDSECIKKQGCGWNCTFWRFLAADGDDTVIFRDTDSRLNHREKSAVNEWLASDKSFHIMRDHPYHMKEILAGMWGVRNGALKGISKEIEDYELGEMDGKYQNDQEFLKDVVYPKTFNDSVVHDEFFDIKPFPLNAPARTSHFFVGQVYNENNTEQF